MVENEVFLTKKQMMQSFTISGSGLYRWVQRGLPKDGRRFPLGPCLDWIKRNVWCVGIGKEGLAEEKLKYQRARTKREELRVQQEEGSLIPRKESISWLSQIVSEAKQGFLNLPRRIAETLMGRDAKEVEAILRFEIHDILWRLSGKEKPEPQELLPWDEGTFEIILGRDGKRKKVLKGKVK